MQPELPCRILTHFDNTSLNRCSDRFEALSNCGLYLLRSAFGVKVFKSSSSDLPQTTRLTNSIACRIFCGLLAVTVCVPLTLIGIALALLSQSHSESYRLVRELPRKTEPVTSPATPVAKSVPPEAPKSNKLIGSNDALPPPPPPAPPAAVSTPDTSVVPYTAPQAALLPITPVDLPPASTVALTAVARIERTADAVTATVALGLSQGPHPAKSQSITVPAPGPIRSQPSHNAVVSKQTIIMSPNGLQNNPRMQFEIAMRRSGNKDLVCTQVIKRANEFLLMHKLSNSMLSYVQDVCTTALLNMTSEMFMEHSFWAINKRKLKNPQNFDLTVTVDPTIRATIGYISGIVLGKVPTDRKEILSSPLAINEKLSGTLSTSTQVVRVTKETFRKALEIAAKTDPTVAVNVHDEKLCQGMSMMVPVDVLDAVIASEKQSQITAPKVSFDAAKVPATLKLMTSGDIEKVVAYIMRDPHPDAIDKACDELASAGYYWGLSSTYKEDTMGLDDQQVQNLVKSMEVVYYNMSSTMFASYVNMMFEENVLMEPNLGKIGLEVLIYTLNASRKPDCITTLRLVRSESNHNVVWRTFVNRCKPKADCGFGEFVLNMPGFQELLKQAQSEKPAPAYIRSKPNPEISFDEILPAGYQMKFMFASDVKGPLAPGSAVINLG